MPTKFTRSVIAIISHIPPGKVLTYGAVAALAGSPRAARQVAWILHSSSRKYNLPWHRVVNSQRRISLRMPGYEQQKRLLQDEGIIFTGNDLIDFRRYLWPVKSLDEISE